MTRQLLPHLDAQQLERRTQAIGCELFEHARRAHGQLSPLNRWAKQVLAWCLADPQLKTQVLRFIDCLPSLRTPRAVVEHLHEYFPTGELRLPAGLRLGVSMTHAGLWTAPAAAAVVHQLVEQAARQFIAGSNATAAADLLERLTREGVMASFDWLGEQVVSEQEAEAYATRYLVLLDALQAARQRLVVSAGSDARPLLHISIKPSSLSARYDPIDVEGSLARVLERLRPILELAVRSEVSVTLDMEQYELRDLTIELAKRLLLEPRWSERLHLGVVIQAYLRDAEEVVGDLLEWLTEHGKRLDVRLVKGAYWDSEVAMATQRGWPVPVFVSKAETDRAFERLTETLLAAHPTVDVQIASHNVRSIAHAMAVADALGRQRQGYEFQLLYGMGHTIQAAIRAMGYPVRVYTPIGELIPGMAYLVRRILENTANESFLRHDLVQDADAARLLQPPDVSGAAIAVPQPPRNEPPLDGSKAADRDQMIEALTAVKAQWGRRYPVLLGDGTIDRGAAVEGRNPARPAEILGTVVQATTEIVDRAVRLAQAAQARWARTPVTERTACLRRAAELMRARRHELAAWEVYEVGKTWREADGDVTEAIDYLRYYSDRMEQLADVRLPQLPGEHNVSTYLPRGVAVVIAPWNFPSAILTGMTAAALVTGNAAIVKPAEQSSIIGVLVTQILREAGVPPVALQCLSGSGEGVGAALAAHPGTHAILFTGSKGVGVSIVQAASQVRPGQRFVKHVVAELGGKNALVIDEDADLDAAVSGTLVSGFGYQGQKCSAASRVIVHRAVYERFVSRLVAATDRLVLGDPAEPGTDLGPLIDADAQQRLTRAIAQAGEQGTIAYAYPSSRVPGHGYFVGPMIVTDLPRTHPIATDELFGPLLCVFRAESFEQALAQANDSDYALTGGVYSRSPSHIQQALRAFEVGNLYINRPITGALVGRQPFGGYKLSGLGTKAGGPDYLLGLMIPKTICENTARHGIPLE